VTRFISINHFILLPIIVFLDLLLGEPIRWHPLAGFGKLAHRVEKHFNTLLEPFEAIAQGFVAWFIIVIPIVVMAWLLATVFGWPMEVLMGMLAIGGRSLKEHAFAVKEALCAGDLAKARTCTSMLVSRDTRMLNEEGLSRATIESVLENASDALFAPLFWFLIGGAPAVVLYRLANTLDAMWGYKNKRFLYFGRFSARVDDVLNYIPARLTAMTWLILGDYKSAKHCWLTQANTWYSPNAGVVMAVGAGALTIKLGGNAIYEGEEKQRPVIGMGHAPVADDIKRSWQLVVKGVVLWSVISVFLAWVF
jgi:adenosylcobinamide-phosphate synthase